MIIPIPGTKSLRHLADTIGASDVAALLTDEEIHALTAVADEASARLGTMPDRMSEAMLRIHDGAIR